MYLFIGCREDGGAEDGSEAGSDDEQADMLAMFDDAPNDNQRRWCWGRFCIEREYNLFKPPSIYNNNSVPFHREKALVDSFSEYCNFHSEHRQT